MQKQQINDNCLCSNILKDFDFDDREKIDKNRIFSVTFVSYGQKISFYAVVLFFLFTKIVVLTLECQYKVCIERASEVLELE